MWGSQPHEGSEMGRASGAPAAAADRMGFGHGPTPGHSLVIATAPQPCPPPASCLAWEQGLSLVNH